VPTQRRDVARGRRRACVDRCGSGQVVRSVDSSRGVGRAEEEGEEHRQKVGRIAVHERSDGENK